MLAIRGAMLRGAMLRGALHISVVMLRGAMFGIVIINLLFWLTFFYRGLVDYFYLCYENKFHLRFGWMKIVA